MSGKAEDYVEKGGFLLYMHIYDMAPTISCRFRITYVIEIHQAVSTKHVGKN